MRNFWSWRGLAVVTASTAVGLAVAMAAGAAASPAPARPGGLAAGARFRLPAIKHVWVIELENEGYAQTFGNPAADPYLARTLPAKGALLTSYYAIGHNSADNYIAQISGQAPNILTQEDCPVWVPTPEVTIGPYHQVLAPEGGCVFPRSVATLGNQLTAAKLSWAAYMQDMGNNPARDRTVATLRGPACGHPATWGIDHTQGATATDQYAVRHEGFMYFRSVTGDARYCAAHVLSFKPLRGDLAAAGRTPAFSWISPNLCDDGHDVPCVTGQPGGLRADRQVPRVLGPGDHGVTGVQGRRADPDHVRRGDDGHRVLRGAERIQLVAPEHAVTGPRRSRRRRRRPGGAVPVHQARDGVDGGVQPLLDAAHDRGHLRPAAPG